MALLILVGRDELDRNRYQWFIQDCYDCLKGLDADLDVRIYPEVGDVNEIECVLVWGHPPGLLRQFSKLKCIAALSAGVDHILKDKNLPSGVPVVRITDSAMAIDITQYVVANVLYWVKRLPVWQQNQNEKKWLKLPPFSLADKTIGIMGLGFLGQKAAEILQGLGLQVIGWSNSSKNLKGIVDFVGQAELKSFLSKADILVCMLPLTLATENILNAENLACLPVGAYVINLGRGEHVEDADLLAALNNGHLAGACLDVFREEPLPETHPFWTHPHIRITPHVASVTNPKTAIPQILENYRRLIEGRPLLNKVDWEKGY